MPLAAISAANGTDLLNLYSQDTGQVPAATAASASTAVLQKAIAVAQLSEAEILGGGSGETTSLNVFA
jgi:hypothetical protein